MSKPGAKVVLTGITRWRRNSDVHPNDVKECICCPDSPSHIFSRGLDLDPASTAHVPHYRRDLWSLVQDAVGDMPEGARVRVVVETIPEEEQ